MKRRILSILLALSIVLIMLPTALAAGTDTWDGTVDINWYNDTNTEFTLETAEQLAGLATLVDNGNTFDDKTVKLGADINLYYVAEGKDEPTSFAPIGGDVAFKGTFDGDGHTISNLYQSGWAFGYEWGSYGSIGLFGELKDATVKNLTIEDAECFVEGGDVGGIAGSASGTCVFENITITDSVFATYNNGNGGIIGWSGAGTYTFKNIDLKSDVVLAGLWGSFDSSIGGVVGQAEPGATYSFENVDIACRIDAYNDCTASYDYYNYRMCGMIMGRLEETTTIDGTKYPDTSQYIITCKDVTVTYGDWYAYHYCDPTPGYNNGRGMRVEPGYAYDGLPAGYDHSQCTRHHMAVIPFNQIFGGDQYGVRGLAAYDGVTVKYPTIATIAFYNAEGQCKKMVTNFLVGNGNTVKESAFDEAAKNVSATVELPNILTGWTVNGQDFDAETEVTEDMLNGNLVLVVKPKIEKILTLNFNGVGSQVIKDGETVTVPAPAETGERPGYHSPGWDAHGGTATELKTGAVLTIDEIYQIILDNNGGTLPLTIETDWKNGVLNLWATGSNYWEANTYTVTFNANGGTGTMAAQTFTYDQEQALTANAFTKDGYTFQGWAESSNGTVQYIDKASVKNLAAEGEVTLYAVWDKNPPVTANYEIKHYQQQLNGTYALIETETKTNNIGNTVTADVKIYEGYELNEEKSTTQTALKPSGTVLALYYDLNEYTVTFDSNGDSDVAAQVVKHGATATEPDEPIRRGYDFEGWYLDGELYDFDTPVTEGITLTAQWDREYRPSRPSTPSKPVAPSKPAEPVVPDEPETPEVCDGGVNCPSYKFIDVNFGDWFHEEVDYVLLEDMFKGMTATTFEPNSDMSRAMVWTVLARMEGVDVENATPWYAKAQAWAMENDVSDGTFPNSAITREQLITMLWRSVGEPSAALDLLARFADNESISGYAVQAMAWAVENGILEGDNGTLKPLANATRAEVAAIMMRFCEMDK